MRLSQRGRTIIQSVATICLLGLTIAAAGGYKYAQAQFVPGPSQATSSLLGQTNSTPPAAGYIGEVLSAVIPIASGFGLGSATSTNISAVNLSAGAWMCDGTIGYQFSNTVSVTNLQGGLNTISGTLPANDLRMNYTSAAAVDTGTTAFVMPVPRQAIFTNGISPVYMVANAAFSVAALQGFGRITCQRAS